MHAKFAGDDVTKPDDDIAVNIFGTIGFSICILIQIISFSLEKYKIILIFTLIVTIFLIIYSLLIGYCEYGKKKSILPHKLRTISQRLITFTFAVMFLTMVVLSIGLFFVYDCNECLIYGIINLIFLVVSVTVTTIAELLVRYKM